MKAAIALRTLLTCIVFAISAESFGATRYCEKGRPWSCFGVIEVGASGGERVSNARLSLFANNEMLMEVVATAPPETRKLLFRAGLPTLYFGLSDEETKLGHPFFFTDYAFALPLMAMEAAYPAGPTSVGDLEPEKEVMLEGRTKARLAIKRESNTRFSYQLAAPDMPTMKGLWEGSKPAILPDATSLTGWRDSELKTYRTLGEFRAKALERAK